MQAIYSQLEYKISQEEKLLREEHFGDSTVVVYEGQPNYDLYDRAITQLVERFPKADNGSKFINSYITLIPKICVVFQNLQPLLAGKQEGGLFLDEVGKAIAVFPLNHPLIGTFTTAKCALVVKDIRLLPQSTMKPNTDLPAPDSDAKGIYINAKTRYGCFDTNPQLMKTEILANIIFGDYVKNNVVLELTSTGDQASTQITIPLEPERIKILPTGSVIRKNGEGFNISQITKNKTLTWINYEWTVNVPFKIIA